MDGMIFVAILITGATVAGVRPRRAALPGVMLTLALLAGSVWYVFA